MQISSAEKQKFILALIEQATFPGHMLEFVLSVKQEVRAATIGAPKREPSLLEQVRDSGQMDAGQEAQHVVAGELTPR